MADGPIMAYSADELQAGARELAISREMTKAAADKLRSATITGAMFGGTPGGAAFVGIVEAARTGQLKGFADESDRSDDLGGRAAASGDMGNTLTDTSTAVARSATAG